MTVRFPVGETRNGASRAQQEMTLRPGGASRAQQEMTVRFPATYVERGAVIDGRRRALPKSPGVISLSKGSATDRPQSRLAGLDAGEARVAGDGARRLSAAGERNDAQVAVHALLRLR